MHVCASQSILINNSMGRLYFTPFVCCVHTPSAPRPTHPALQMYNKISSKQLRKFSSWHKLWVAAHVPTEGQQACDHWLQAITLGQPGLASKKTPEEYAGRTRNKYFTTVLPSPFTHGRI